MTSNDMPEVIWIDNDDIPAAGRVKYRRASADSVTLGRDVIEGVVYYLKRLEFNDRSEGDYTEIWAKNALQLLSAAMEGK